MKKYFLICLIFSLCFSFSTTLFAQKVKKTKEEVALEKEWAKKLKLLKPLDYKQLLEEKEALATQVSDLERSNSSLKSELEGKDAEIAKAKKELEDYTSGATTAPATTKTSTAASTTGKRAPVEGVVYKVQIGSFKSKDLTKYFDNNPNFSGDVDADGTKKYTLGAFSDYWEADKFKKALREMGVKGAWVVPYKNGERVNIKDVLEGTI